MKEFYERNKGWFWAIGGVSIMLFAIVVAGTAPLSADAPSSHTISTTASPGQPGVVHIYTASGCPNYDFCFVGWFSTGNHTVYIQQYDVSGYSRLISSGVGTHGDFYNSIDKGVTFVVYSNSTSAPVNVTFAGIW